MRVNHLAISCLGAMGIGMSNHTVVAQTQGGGSVAASSEFCPSTTTFAYCGLSECSAYNGIAYCKCKVVENEVSQTTTESQDDACDVALGLLNSGSAILSTFYNGPNGLVGAAPETARAFYECPQSTGVTYALCDGAICFTSTTNVTDFQGLGDIADDEIVCACGVTTSTAAKITIPGPYTNNECNSTYTDAYCFAELAASGQVANGAKLAAGVPSSDEGSTFPVQLWAKIGNDPDEFPGQNACPGSDDSSGTRKSFYSTVQVSTGWGLVALLFVLAV